MSEQMREEFSAWYLAEVTQSYGESVRTQAEKNLAWVRQDGSFADPMLRLACLAWQASREQQNLHPLQQTLRDNGELIAAQATIAQQAQMIEHLRGGPTPGYTAVDMTTAAAQGFRDGVASVVVDLPTVGPEPEAPEDAIDDSYMDAHHAKIRMRNACVKAIIAAGGSVKE